MLQFAALARPQKDNVRPRVKGAVTGKRGEELGPDKIRRKRRQAGNGPLRGGESGHKPGAGSAIGENKFLVGTQD
jgi:hypothetical protein